jgi:hypothetical protein
MSDLVERVKIALREVPDKNGVTDVDGEARAAIKAVAEWGRNNFYDDKPLEEFLGELLAQLKEGSE